MPVAATDGGRPVTCAGEDDDGIVDVPDEACRAEVWSAAAAGNSI